MRRTFLIAVLALAACGDDGGTRPARHPSSSRGGGKDADGEVEQRVVVERMPDGSLRKTTIRTTKRVVEAPPPPARPEDPYPGDPLVKYNVEQINRYRGAKGLGPVLYDAKISAFATKGSERLSKDHKAHAHFGANVDGAPGFGSRSAENQGDPAGVPVIDPSDAVKNGKKQIDVMLKLMMDEGPGGGHHDNMMNPRFRRVGIGLVYAGGRLYLTNDFSD